MVPGSLRKRASIRRSLFTGLERMAVNPQHAAVLGRRARLELDEVLASLVVDGYLTGEDAKRVRMGSRSGKTAIELHPLVVIANAKPENRRDAGRPLTLEGLMEWI